ncbi:MAG: GDP-mannose 4,6-dehydratase [Deltaproteobacteria bacterium]|nr:GDP-mannose 4,6-dehydratase [Deltaproteobacteria bacterium]
MKSVVTGVAGFVGSSIADALLKEGHDVVGIDCFVDYYPREMKARNLEGALANPKFTFLEENLLRVDLSKLLDGAEWIFHQAAQAGVRASWGDTFQIYTDNNITATQRLLEFVKQGPAQKTVKKLVYASSSSVYGSAETLPTTEQTIPNPVSPYGVSKLAAEYLMRLYATEFGVPTASLRYFTVYGPRQRPDMAFRRLITSTFVGEPFVLFGDGEQSRDFTFINDIVEGNLAAARASTSELVFNLGGGDRVTMNHVISKLEEILGKKIAIDRRPRAHGDARHTGADTSLARKHLGFAPKTSLEDGLRAEVEWVRSSLS